MSESSLFEHIKNVPSKKIKRLSQRQVERLLTPHESEVTVSGLLWSLELGAYALPSGELAIGFDADSRAHEHDQWLFFSRNPVTPWQNVDADGGRNFRQLTGFGAFVDAVRGHARHGLNDTEVDFKLLRGLAGAVARQKQLFKDEQGLDVSSRDVLLAARLPGALNRAFLQPGNQLDFAGAHDLLYHPVIFLDRYPEYNGLPLTYVRHLYGLEAGPT